MRKAFGAAALLAFGLAGLAWIWTARVPPDGSAGTTASPAPRVWPPGTSHRYRFEYRSVESVRPLAEVGHDPVAARDAIEGSLHLQGELIIDVYAEAQRSVGLRIEKLEVAKLSVEKQDVPGLDRILTSGAVVFRLGSQDTFSHYIAPEGSDPLLVQTLWGLGMRLQVAAAPSAEAESFEVEEQLPHGRVASRYEKTAAHAWKRTRPRYLSLDVAPGDVSAAAVELSAAARIGLRPEGAPESIQDTESVVVSTSGTEVLRGTSELELTWIASAPLKPSPLLAGKTRALAEVPTSDQLEKRLLAERTGGLTREAAMALLRRHLNGGVLPDHKRALWQLTGLLELEPEFARDLLALLLEPNTNSKGRALLLDILVSVGHDEAQAAVRAALDAAVAKDDPGRGMQYQRLGLIDEPNADTVRYAQAELLRATASDLIDSKMLAAYTAGAVAGHALESEDPALQERATEIGVTLSGLLGAAANPVEEKHFIKALANTKDQRHREQISSFSTSPDDGVRQSVARAMREPQTPSGLDVLIALAADPDPVVQGEAIRAMDAYRLSNAQWDAMTAIIVAKRLHRRNHRLLLDFVKYQRDVERDATTRLLQAMLTIGLEGEVAGAVRLLLSR